MIIDQLANADLYRGLPKGLVQALDYLRKTDLAKLPVGRQEIDGSRLYALVQEYTPKPVEQGKWEAHQKYHDVQYVVRGVERMGYAAIGGLKVTQPYDAQKDAVFFEGRGDLLTVPGGTFMIFAPQDAHMPGLAPLGAAGGVRKIVVKVAVEG